MSRKLKIILGVSAVTITITMTAVALWFFVFRPPSTTDEDPIVFDSNYEIKFRDSVYINDHSISVDGSAEMDVPCRGTHKKPKVFGFLDAGANGKLQLSCAMGYMEGISATYINARGDRHHMDLAQADGENGDFWDTRAWVSRDGDRNLLIRMVTLTSSEQALTGATRDCTMKKLLYFWNPDTQELVEDPRDVSFEIPPFPDTPVSSNCFDDRGNWKGI